MISLVSTLSPIDFADAAYAKTACHFAAYSKYPKIALFWEQTDENGATTAVMSLIDGNMCLSDKNANAEELKEFLRAIAPQNIFTATSTAQKLGLEIDKICDTLYSESPHRPDKPGVENTYEGIERVYEILSSHLSVPERDIFVADMSHRLRRGWATYVTSPFSAAVLLLGEKFAMLGGLAVYGEKRGTGIGAATLNRLTASVKTQKMFICCEAKNTAFYKKCGFTVAAQAAYCKGSIK